MDGIKEPIEWLDFEKLDIRVGTVVKAEIFAEVRKPAYKVEIDFGELGIKKSSAQLTQLYSAADLVGKQVICVINFPPKQIATMKSQCLILGAVNGPEVTLLTPDKLVRNGLGIG
jgi:tRNA-binding protein